MRPLADAGFLVFGVDLDIGRLRLAKEQAAKDRTTLHAWAADLTQIAPRPRRFDLVLCVRYLDRPRWTMLVDAVRPGGFLIYETFTTEQLSRGVGPRAPEHLLHPGELRRLAADWDVWTYEETSSPEAMARLLARRPL